MPAYNFNERFVSYIQEGTKRKTIRGFRKAMPVVGERVYLFTGMRTKWCKRLNAVAGDVLRDWNVIAIDHAGILEVPVSLEDYQYLANAGEAARYNWFFQRRVAYMHSAVADDFAWEDGFRHADAPDRRAGCFKLMKQYWLQHQGGLPFVGIVYKW